MNKVKKQEVINQVVKDWNKIADAIQDLYELYSEFDLNEIQPKNTNRVVPMDLLEWQIEIGSHIEDWEDSNKKQIRV